MKFLNFLHRFVQRICNFSQTFVLCSLEKSAYMVVHSIFSHQQLMLLNWFLYCLSYQQDNLLLSQPISTLKIAKKILACSFHFQQFRFKIHRRYLLKSFFFCNTRKISISGFITTTILQKQQVNFFCFRSLRVLFPYSLPLLFHIITLDSGIYQDDVFKTHN